MKFGAPGARRSDLSAALGNEPVIASRPAGRNHLLQYLRAVAAVSVVLYHASHYLLQFRGNADMISVFDPFFGKFGVILFFAISGYLMAELAVTTPPARFLAHRVIRIYPIYWLTVTIVVVINLLLKLPSPFDLVSLLLVPGGTQTYLLGIEWTLPFELTFYLIVFGVMVAGLRERLPVLAAGWVIAILVLLAVKPEWQQGQFPTLLHLPVSENSLPFAAALLIPAAIRRGLVPAVTPLLGAALVVAARLVPEQTVPLLSAGCVLLVAAAARPRATASRPAFPALVAMGDWSFALYLCHTSIIVWVYRLAGPSVDSMVLWPVAVGGAVLASVGLGKLDLALYGRLKRAVDRGRVVLVRGIGAAFVLAMAILGPLLYLQTRHDAVLRATAEELAREILAARPPEETDLEATMDRLGWRRSDAVRGSLDSTIHQPPEVVRVDGWVLGPRGGEADLAVLVFLGREYVGVTLPRKPRPDVSAAFRRRFAQPGFNEVFRHPAVCAAGTPLALVLSPGTRRYVLLRGNAVMGCPAG